jgi:hypothetical protein
MQSTRPESDVSGQELYLAGEKVLPGVYRQIGGDRLIRLEKEDILPASLDGKVACYLRVDSTWRQLSESRATLPAL